LYASDSAWPTAVSIAYMTPGLSEGSKVETMAAEMVHWRVGTRAERKEKKWVDL
jgi:hypothetical protein